MTPIFEDLATFLAKALERAKAGDAIRLT